MSTNSRFWFTAFGFALALEVGGCAAATEENVADPQPVQAAQEATPEETGQTSSAVTADGWGGWGLGGVGAGAAGTAVAGGAVGGLGWGGLGWGGAPLVGFSPEDAPAEEEPQP